MLPCQQTTSEHAGQGKLTLGTLGPQVSVLPSTSLAACTLLHLQVNVQFLFF